MAPPVYKPLTSAGGLSGAPGIPDSVFNTPYVSFRDNERINEALQAQELANQINSIQAQQYQQRFDNDQQLQEAMRTQFGQQPDGTTPEFDPNAALSLAQKLAIQQGDIDTALSIERTKRDNSYSSDMPLTPSQKELFQAEMGISLPDGMTMRDLNTLSNLRRTNTYEQQVNDPRLARNRELNAILQEQRATGTQIRPVPYAAANKFGAGEGFVSFMNDMERTYLPYISKYRDERFLAQAVNPNSAAARLFGELNLAAKQAALALEDRVTDQDYKTIQEITTPHALDTMETIYDRMQRLKLFIQERNKADLNAMQASGFNVDGLRQQLGLREPSTLQPYNAGSNVPVPQPVPAPQVQQRLPRNPDGSPLTREQFLATMGRGQ